MNRNVHCQASGTAGLSLLPARRLLWLLKAEFICEAGASGTYGCIPAVRQRNGPPEIQISLGNSMTTSLSKGFSTARPCSREARGSITRWFLEPLNFSSIDFCSRIKRPSTNVSDCSRSRRQPGCPYRPLSSSSIV